MNPSLIQQTQLKLQEIQEGLLGLSSFIFQVEVASIVWLIVT